MVNTDFDAARPRFGNLLVEWLAETVSELGSRLTVESQAEGLFRMSSGTLGGSLRATLAAVEAAIASSLVTDLLRVRALGNLLDGVVEFETVLRNFLAGRARRHLNTIVLNPAVSTRTAQTLQLLDVISPAEAMPHLLSPVREKAKSAFDALLALPAIETLGQLGTFAGEQELTAILTCEQQLMGSLRGLACVLERTMQVSRELLTANDQSVGGVTRRHLAERFQALESFGRGERLHEMREALDRAERNLVAGDSLGMILSLGDGLSAAEMLFDDLQRAEVLCSCVAQRALEAEALLYGNALGRRLVLCGEPIGPTEKLAEAMLGYCRAKGVAPLDLIDEEVHRLVPAVRRETLAKARLEVRLSDLDYPLSVAHKDWVLSNIER